MSGADERIREKLAAMAPRFGQPAPMASPAERSAKIVAAADEAAQLAARDERAWLAMSDEQRARFVEAGDGLSPAAWHARERSKSVGPSPWEQQRDQRKADERDLRDAGDWVNGRLAALDKHRRQPPVDEIEREAWSDWCDREATELRRLQVNPTMARDAYRRCYSRGTR